MDLRAIGVVHSSIAERGAMPVAGVPAVVEVFPEFADGLRGIEQNSHLIVIGWFDRAARDRLRVRGRRGRPGEQRGVFGLRSSARPNPLGLTSTRLLAVDGCLLRLERLDFLDGTPVVDLKRYSPGWDCIFAATTPHDRFFPEAETAIGVQRDLLVTASNFHGEACRGAALAVRMVALAMLHWRIGPRVGELRVVGGGDGCIIDALQGITGATLGTGRLQVGRDAEYRLSYLGETLIFRLELTAPATVEAVLAALDGELFSVGSAPA